MTFQEYKIYDLYIFADLIKFIHNNFFYETSILQASAIGAVDIFVMSPTVKLRNFNIMSYTMYLILNLKYFLF